MKQLTPIALFILLTVSISSCTKEVDRWFDQEAETVYDTLRTLPDARIIEYKVANVNDDPIYSAVDDSKGTITVFLPSYYALAIIQPEIVLPEGTTVSPSADEPIPVFPDTPVTYEVTSAKGEKNTYTIEVVVQQQGFGLGELSTSAENPTVYTRPHTHLYIRGSNFIPSSVVTKAYLYDTDGNYVEELRKDANYEVERTNMGVFFSNDVPDGLYYVEVRSYALTKRMTYPIRIRTP